MSSAKQHNIDRFCSYIEYFRFIHRGLSRDQNVILKKVVCFPSHNIKKKSKHIFLHFPKHFYSKLYENSIVCYVGGAKVILISHIAAKQQSLVSFSRKREETDGEEYRRRISKRGGGREGGLCRCHRGAARGDPHCRCNLRAIVSQELLFNLEPFKKSWQPS